MSDSCFYHRTDDIALHIVDCAATACFTVGGKIPVSVVAAQGSDDDTRMSTLFRQLITGQFFIGLIHDATEGVIDIVEGLPTKAVHGKGEVFNICRQFCEIDANDFIISIPLTRQVIAGVDDRPTAGFQFTKPDGVNFITCGIQKNATCIQVYGIIATKNAAK